jgi:hypothetical protein
MKKLCPECKLLAGVQNGHYTPKKNSVTVFRFICRSCDHKWKGDADGVPIAKGGTRYPEGDFLKVIALAAIGVALDQIEALLGFKSETMSDWLEAAAASEDWPRLREAAGATFKITDAELDRLTERALAAGSEKGSFHGLSPRVRPRLSEPMQGFVRVCLDPIRFKEFIDGLARGGHSQTDEQVAHDLAFSKRLDVGCWPAGDCILEPGVVQEILERRDRAERILDSTLIVTFWGELVRPDEEMNRLRWVKTIQKISPARLNVAKMALTRMEAHVFKEVCSPVGARAYAMSDPLPDRTMRPRAQKITLAHLIRAHFGDSELNGQNGERWISYYVNSLRSLAEWLAYCERASSQEIGKLAT